MEEELAYPRTVRRAFVAAWLVVLAVLVILCAMHSAQAVPDGTPIPTCAGGRVVQPVQPCNWQQ